MSCGVFIYDNNDFIFWNICRSCLLGARKTLPNLKGLMMILPFPPILEGQSNFFYAGAVR